MVREGQTDTTEHGYVVALCAANDHPVGWGHHLADPGRVADPVGVLDTETKPEPGVEERRIARWRDDRVPDDPGVHPAAGKVAVEVADDVRLRCRVAGALDPHVRAPPLATRDANRVADQVVAAYRDRAIGLIPGSKLLDLATGLGRILKPTVKVGNAASLRPLAPAHRPSGRVDPLRPERQDRDRSRSRRHPGAPPIHAPPRIT